MHVRAFASRGPSPSEGVTTRRFCFSLADDDCFGSLEINAVNCWYYPLYELKNVPSCDLRDCATFIIPW
ncbi:MAG: hypothetical protein H6713_28605 [Myxococcales bacterium]|nr:hypothetical protein [Myxococcales bacterium]